MGFRTMKQDLFTIKALQSKGYDMNEILAMTDEELEALPISTKLIEGAKLYKLRGGKTAESIAEDIADLMMREESAPIKEEVIEDYKAVPLSELEGVMAVPLDSDEGQRILASREEILSGESSETIEEEVQEVEIIRSESNHDDIQIIKESLQRKEAKSFQPFIKHLKAEVPEAILDSVDSTLVAELIETRIAEVKAAQEKTK